MIPSKVEHEITESPKQPSKKLETLLPPRSPLIDNPLSPGAPQPVQSSSSGSPLQYTPRKRVIRFNPGILNRRIPHLNDIPHSVVAATWIQPEEYLEIRKRCIMTVKMMFRGHLTQDDLEYGALCFRGLEGKTKSGAARRREHKFDSIAAVMEEQSLQWNEDVEDDEALMEVYSVFSVPCADEAHQMGLADAAATRAYLSGTTGTTESATERTTPATSDLPKVPVASRLVLGSDPTTTSGLVDKLRAILFVRSNRAALLRDIGKNFYNEASIERRRTRQETDSVYKRRNNTQTLTTQIQDYFTQRKNHLDPLPSLEPVKESNEDDEESSSTSEGSAVSDTFTSELHDIFHSRKRRQALLDSIERGYHT